MPSRPTRPPVRKRFGQHFLEPAWAAKAIRTIAPAATETFLEIGPGRGVLTFALADKVRDILAFEIDRDLAAVLRGSSPGNVHVIEGDFLAQTGDGIRRELDRLLASPAEVRVVGNLPYNVASPILFKLVELHAEGVPLRDATVMLQREVANRLLAKPGTRDYGVLTVLIRHRADVERLFQLPAGAFRPVPNVESTMVRLRFRSATPPVRDSRVFEGLTGAIFTRRRKTLSNALRAYPLPAALPPSSLLEMAGLDPQRRPETLTISELAALADLVAAAAPMAPG